jgi:S1-C subfamily serine protease
MVVLAATVLACSSEDIPKIIPGGPLGDPVEVGSPPVEHGLTDQVSGRLLAATVGVRGLDCRRAQVGSGFVVTGTLVVTAAHVVAGIDAPILTVAGEELASRVVGFDPVADLAVLEPVSDLHDLAPLEIGLPAAGSVAAILVHEADGPRLVPAALESLIRATGADVYGRPAEGRDAMVLSASVLTGHSGAAVVDRAGVVVGVTFSRARGGSPVAYAVQASAVRSLLERVESSPEPAGPCID